MSDELKANLNPYMNRIGVKQIADNFVKRYGGKNKDKLKEVSKNFEAMFVQMMLKAMRRTVPKSSFSLQGLENDIYTSMYDEQIAKNIAEKGSLGMSDFLYNQLNKTIHERNAIPLKNENFRQLKKSEELIPLEKEEKTVPLKDGHILRKRIENYEKIINEAAEQNGIDASLVKAVIAQESSGKNNAVSSSGAKGLMQLKDITAQEVGVNDVFDPADNIHGGTKYLKKMLDYNNGDVTLALASYNAGFSNVRRFNGIPPFKETQEYVSKVMDYYEIFKENDTGLKLA